MSFLSNVSFLFPIYTWLRTKGNTADSQTPPGTPPPQTAALPKTGGAAAQVITSAKRRHVVDGADADVVKKIKAKEIELTDRTSALRGTKLTVRLYSCRATSLFF